ncbi:MAG: YbgC/FadM family acyl-CoA thioesterase [Acidiferrobacterales bacterium]|nr:YbgC/FadM family acyl-CoA thioesterase [Acidiferrobacterales bacterium]
MTNVFSQSIEIDYADTDAGGVVYHANYLTLMERTRSACLRHAGLPVTVLRDQFNVVFVVTESNLKYLQPAFLDDTLNISIAVSALRGASILCHQQVTRAERVLVDAKIKIATIAADTFLPCKMPSELRRVFAQYQIHST